MFVDSFHADFNEMKRKIVIIALSILFSSCGKNAVDCITLENDLSLHPHIADLDIFLSMSEAADDFIENCHSYYDEMESMVDRGCFDGWNADTVSAYRNSICGGPLAGVWRISSLKTYDSPECAGPYTNMVDTVAWNYGSRLGLFLEFTLDEAIQRIIGSYSGPELCSMGLGTITGDTCDTFIGGIPIDSLCTMGGGVYSTGSDSCNYNILISTMNYVISADGITLISFAGTDSVEVFNGSWGINNGTSLNMAVSDSNSCIEITASK